MYTNVWVVTFISSQDYQFVLGVYSTHEKAIQAVERAANDSGEWLIREWLKYSLSHSWAHAYNDEEMTDSSGVYHIRRHRLQ